mgnify:CR=1 FL=1
MKFSKLKPVLVGLAMVLTAVVVYYNHDTIKELNNKLGSTEEVEPINPEFANYITAFTSGYISSGSTIKVKLSKEFAGTTQLNTALSENYFSFEPAMKGKTVWKDAQTLEFIPDEPMNAGMNYKAKFYLHKLVEVKKELREFDFQFRIIEQSVQLQADELKVYHSNDYSYYSLSGMIVSSDKCSNAQIEQCLIAGMENKSLPVKWQHDEGGTTHRFVLDSIERPATASGTLQLTCNGESMGLDYLRSLTYLVPAKEVFEVISVNLVNEEEPYLLVTFSNPLDPNQSLEGLMNFDNLKETRFIISNNQVLVYPSVKGTGTYLFKIETGVKDGKGRNLKESSEHSIVFSELKPAVRFSGNGNILPSSTNLTVPFECVNLRAVDVSVIKIYENNVLQFLQNNSLEGSSQITQVGKRIIQKRVNLGISNPLDYRVWKKFSLDLSSLFKAEPGAIYRVVLKFRKSYSTYSCLGNSLNDKFEMEEVTPEKDEDELSYFNYYNDDYGNEYSYEDMEEDYHWEDRDNPCKSYYYTAYGRSASRNFLASDLGITFKKGSNNAYFLVANDLLSTEPQAGVELEFYDYQKQLIQRSRTNADGQVYITLPQKPYFLVAKKENQRAYLRLDEASTLPVSMYDVGGESIKKGLKGFIYGERGVWRPGDTLFLNFILEDKLATLPENHPVSFDLLNPQGQLVKHLVSTRGIDGFYAFAIPTDQAAPTGFWNAEVKVGAVKFSKSIRIETIMPNRLKLNVQIGDNRNLQARQVSKGSLHANWLTGAVASNLSANIGLTLKAATTQFTAYPGYQFTDNTIRFESQNLMVFDGKIDADGNATFPVDVKLDANAPGKLQAQFVTKVTEPGGAFSVDRFSMDYSPFDAYVGVKLDSKYRDGKINFTNKEHHVKVVTLNAAGKAISCPNLKLELIKIRWRWWWNQYEDDIWNYANDEYHETSLTKLFSTKNGSADVPITMDDNQWGRYLLKVTDVEGGHSSSQVVFFDWANWMDREGEDNSESKIVANMLSFKTDKESYKTNEEVLLSIPTPKDGRALVTVENGSRVLNAFWVNTQKGTTQFKFKVEPNMAPNVYVHVSLLQPHTRDNDLPIRLYGVVPVKVDDPETHLHPQIQMPAVLVPEQLATMTVSEEKGKEMAFTIAVVDVGLLDITRFKTPEPHSTFYAKEAHGVKTWDVYDNVIGAFGANLERILSIGGDGSEVNKDGSKANRFKPMVRFFGPYHLNKNEKKTISFKMPMYVGSVRTMVIAGYKGAYGSIEKTTPVKAPLMVLATLPRVLSVNEEVKLPVSVFGGNKALGPVKISLELNGLLKSTIKTQEVTIGKDQEKLVTFQVKAGTATGVAKAKILASGGGATASFEIELEIRNPNPFQTKANQLFLAPGKSFSELIKGIGVPGSNTGVLELSVIPPVNLETRLDYLINYPHGCIEQTTSQVFAQLFLMDVMDLSSSRKQAIETNIRGGINRLMNFQLSTGGMSYWPGGSYVSDWGTAYAGHFLFSAEKKGYSVPKAFKQNWLKFETNEAQKFVPSPDSRNGGNEVQAYRLYVMALSGNPLLGAMNRLREYYALGYEARLLLAEAYLVTGQIQEAQKLLESTNKASRPREHYYYTYGSEQREKAIRLQLLCGLNDITSANKELNELCANLCSDSWLSTQSTAFSLFAVYEYIQKFGGNASMQWRCAVNGNEQRSGASRSFVSIPIDFRNNQAQVDVTNQGKGNLSVRWVNRGKPTAGNEKETAQNIRMQVRYTTMEGAVLDPSNLPQGTDFKMIVTVTHIGTRSSLPNIALSCYIPSGWEIHNERLNDASESAKSNEYTYQDIRDDKVLTYFDLRAGESKSFTVLLNAAYEGNFYLPACNAEAMYDNSVYANTVGQWIRVVKK